MRNRWILAGFLAVATFPISGRANSHHGGGHHGAFHGGMVHPPISGSPGIGLAARGGGWGWYGLPYYGTIGPIGPSYFTPTYPQMAPIMMPQIVDRGPVGGPMPPARLVEQGGVPVRTVKRADPAKGAQLVTIGDRLFRAGNLKRAAERYEQAIRSDPAAAAPRIRMAQVALVRGQYRESADQIRAAVAADPNWLNHAPDIQSIYGEPADFTRQISKLESHVLVEPSDRDAWLVLGAELYFSGQTRRASDIFLRLSDRKPDPALKAFLDASNAPKDVEK